MNANQIVARWSWRTAVGVAAIMLAGHAGPTMSQEMKLELSGTQEVPPIETAGKGSGTMTVGADKSVSGSVTTTGVNGVAAHIHMGSAGKNGPVIIPLTKSGDSTWVVPAGAMLKDDQYAAFKAGDLYVNVHSPTHKGGEVRAQLKP
ncbi:MAG: CHRD domain-containing protein [Burkholderiales bacterium]